MIVALASKCTLPRGCFCRALVTLDLWEGSTKGWQCYDIADVWNAKFCFLPFRMHTISPSCGSVTGCPTRVSAEKMPSDSDCLSLWLRWLGVSVHSLPSKVHCRPQNSSRGALTAVRFSVWVIEHPADDNGRPVSEPLPWPRAVFSVCFATLDF